MALGFSTQLLAGSHSEPLFRPLEQLQEVVFVLFFTVAGLHFAPAVVLSHAGLIVLYFLLRAGGQIVGAMIGARLAGAPWVISHNVGLVMLPQGGVAIGMALMLTSVPSLEGSALLIINIVTATTLLTETFVRWPLALAWREPVNLVKQWTLPRGRKQMKTSEWLEKHPVRVLTIAADCSLQDAARLLLNDPEGRDLFVLGGEGKICGHLGFWHVATLLLAELRPSHSIREMIERITLGTVADHMSDHVMCVGGNEEVDDILYKHDLFQQPAERRVEDIPVVDEQHRLLGVIRLSDLLRDAVGRIDAGGAEK